jgi:hypothetical protein
MNTPFRKLIRIAVIIISLIILFNFFGYYLIRARSEENEKMTQLCRQAEDVKSDDREGCRTSAHFIPQRTG